MDMIDQQFNSIARQIFERRLLGTVLFHPERWRELYDHERWFDARNQLVSSAMRQLGEEQCDVDLIGVCRTLEARGELEHAGGYEYVCSLLSMELEEVLPVA